MAARRLEAHPLVAGRRALAASVPDSSGVVSVPAFVGLGAPHWDALRGAHVARPAAGRHRWHVARAALESIALQSADLLEAVGSTPTGRR